MTTIPDTARLLNYEKAMEPDDRVRPPSHRAIVTVSDGTRDSHTDFRIEVLYRVTPDAPGYVTPEILSVEVEEATHYLSGKGFRLPIGEDMNAVNLHARIELHEHLIEAVLSDYAEGQR